MRFLLPALLCVASVAFGQQAQPDRWKGLIIDQSTPDDAVRILGQPSGDKLSRLFITGFDSKWFTRKVNEPKYRRLEFKKVQGVDRAFLSFLDGVLVSIDIDLAEQSPAAALSRIYGIRFAPKIRGLDEAFSPADFERNEGRVYPKRYPDIYSLIGVSEKTFISGMVLNSGFGSILKKSVGGTETGDFPGKIAWIQIISRRLENFDGAGALSGDAPSALSSKSTATPDKKACYEAGRKIPCP
jgi:hypothetical protein